MSRYFFSRMTRSAMSCSFARYLYGFAGQDQPLVVMALSQAYKEGFGDGWSDARAGRDTESIIQSLEQQPGAPYRSQYATGYREGARAFSKKLEGRFAPSRRQDPKTCPHQTATQRRAGSSYICDACGAEVA